LQPLADGRPKEAKMAQEYQPRRFFRNAPNCLLERYFAARNVLSEWTSAR
jgi:hypothetical protein